jgi:hypothetical protein
MSIIEELNREVRAARQIASDAQQSNYPRWPAYNLRAYVAWQRLELAKRAINQIDQ